MQKKVYNGKRKKEYTKTAYQLPTREFVFLPTNDANKKREIMQAYDKMLNNKNSDLTTDGMLKMQKFLKQLTTK